MRNKCILYLQIYLYWTINLNHTIYKVLGNVYCINDTFTFNQNFIDYKNELFQIDIQSIQKP